MAKRLFNERNQFFDSSGNPLSGGQLFFYVAQSVGTRQNTYSDAGGTIPNTNPIVLDAFGRPTVEIWLTTGAAYKVILANSGDGGPVIDPVSPIWTEDNITGINDVTAAASEWTVGPAPTFISTSSFSLAGDQTSTFDKSRRLKIVDAGGTKYGTITNSVFTTLTTVTVAVDNGGVLASPMSAVSYGVIDGASPSIDGDQVNRKGNSVAAAATTDIWSAGGTEMHVTGATGPITSFGTAAYAGNRRTIIWDGTPSVTHNATTLQIPGGQSVTVSVGDRWEVVADTAANAIVTSITKASGLQQLTLPRDYISGFALTTASVTTYDVAAGQAMDSTNAATINGTALAGKSQATWAAGAAAGGKLSAAAMANATWYYWYALLKDSDGSVDYGFDVATTPTLPSGYTKYRYIGARKTQAASTSWETMTQHGDLVKFSTPPALDVSTIASTSPRTLVTVNVPAVRVEWVGNVQASVTGTQTQVIIFTDPSDTDVAPGNGATPLGSIGFGQASGVAQTTIMQVRCWANTASQVGARPTIGGGQIFIQTIGFIDPRGKPV